MTHGRVYIATASDLQQNRQPPREGFPVYLYLPYTDESPPVQSPLDTPTKVHEVMDFTRCSSTLEWKSPGVKNKLDYIMKWLDWLRSKDDDPLWGENEREHRVKLFE